MKTDIIFCGVGGQGILSVATIIGQAATACGLHLKQAEVHGMSQRGGDVQSHMRISSDTVWSDLIPLAGADLVISMEPLEVLRYLPWMSPSCAVVSASEPFINIPSYPSAEELGKLLEAVPGLRLVDIGKDRSANMVLLGAAAKSLSGIPAEALREAIRTVFAAKGDSVVAANIEAFDKGYDME